MDTSFNKGREEIPGFKEQCLTIGENLRALREEKKEALKNVAKAVKCAPTTLRRLEKGEYNYRVNLLKVLSEYYNVAPRSLAIKGRYTNKSPENKNEANPKSMESL